MIAVFVLLGVVLVVFGVGFVVEALWAERQRLGEVSDGAAVRAHTFLAGAVAAWGTAAVLAGALVSAAILYGAAAVLLVKARRAALDAADRRAGAW